METKEKPRIDKWNERERKSKRESHYVLSTKNSICANVEAKILEEGGMGGGGKGILHPRDLSSTPPSLDGLLSATSVCISLSQNSTKNPLHPLLSHHPGHLPLPCHPHNSTPHVHIRGLSWTHSKHWTMYTWDNFLNGLIRKCEPLVFSLSHTQTYITHKSTDSYSRTHTLALSLSLALQMCGAGHTINDVLVVNNIAQLGTEDERHTQSQENLGDVPLFGIFLIMWLLKFETKLFWYDLCAGINIYTL